MTIGQRSHWQRHSSSRHVEAFETRFRQRFVIPHGNSRDRLHDSAGSVPVVRANLGPRLDDLAAEHRADTMQIIELLLSRLLAGPERVFGFSIWRLNVDVALEVGFERHETFSRAFRRRFGLAPRDYRATHRVWPPAAGRNGDRE